MWKPFSEPIKHNFIVTNVGRTENLLIVIKAAQIKYCDDFEINS